ncbi:hypothetical protein AAEX28_15925 [Lentisphaerota bacterium WC36G]|nr:hypothetical protein LJT99_02685 [Lentisphaerae bacterium WC36]
MKYINILWITILVGLVGCTKNTFDKEKALAYVNSREMWKGGFIFAIGSDLNAEKNRNNKLYKTYFTCVAIDSTYEHSGIKNFCDKNQLRLLKEYYKEGQVKEAWFEDPFDLNDYFDKNSNSSPYPLVWGISKKVIENKNAYEKFKKWFKKKVTEK